jgi:hypothetical protein
VEGQNVCRRTIICITRYRNSLRHPTQAERSNKEARSDKKGLNFPRHSHIMLLCDKFRLQRVARAEPVPSRNLLDNRRICNPTEKGSVKPPYTYTKRFAAVTKP